MELARPASVQTEKLALAAPAGAEARPGPLAGLSTSAAIGLGLVVVGLIAALVLTTVALRARREREGVSAGGVGAGRRGERTPGPAQGRAREGAEFAVAPERQIEALAGVVASLAEELDARAQRLEVLIARAEALAERLESAAEASNRVGDVPRAVQAASASAGDLGRAGVDGAGVDAPNSAAGGGDGSAEVDERSAKAVRLHRQGLSPVQIAQTLGMHVGHVELVLSLSRAQGGAGATRGA